ncbi:hypothetical protein I3760_10G020700 [Carya illinoinensis]|nr:hypothetical protein I3760_10G020700 [Carya illinoinensis]
MKGGGEPGLGLEEKPKQSFPVSSSFQGPWVVIFVGFSCGSSLSAASLGVRPSFFFSQSTFLQPFLPVHFLHSARRCSTLRSQNLVFVFLFGED